MVVVFVFFTRMSIASVNLIGDPCSLASVVFVWKHQDTIDGHPNCFEQAWQTILVVFDLFNKSMGKLSKSLIASQIGS